MRLFVYLKKNSNIESSEVIDFLKNEIGFTDEELKEIVELL